MSHDVFAPQAFDGVQHLPLRRLEDRKGYPSQDEPHVFRSTLPIDHVAVGGFEETPFNIFVYALPYGHIPRQRFFYAQLDARILLGDARRPIVLYPQPELFTQALSGA